MLDYPWLKVNETSAPDMGKSTFYRFSKSNKFKVIVLSFLATRMSDLQKLCKNNIKTAKMFKEHDRNRDGSLEYE
jgi:hypothetical protein